MHTSPDHELYLLPLEPINSLPAGGVLQQMRERRAAYLKDQWFQPNFRLPLKLVDYMLCLLDGMSLGDMESIVKHASVLLLKRFIVRVATLKMPPQFERLQIYALGCIAISCRFYGFRDQTKETKRLSITKLHELSAHAFNSQQLVGCQIEILDALQYDIVAGSSPGMLIPEWVDLLLALTKNLIFSTSFDNLRDFSLGLANFILIDDRVLRKYYPDEIAAGILFMATTRLTMSSDYFPMIKRLAILLRLSMEQIFRVSRDIKTVVLGEVTPLERGQSAEESCENSGSHEELL